SALAADPVYHHPVPEPAATMPEAFSWAGGYIGLNGGYAGGSARHVRSPAPTPPAPPAVTPAPPAIEPNPFGPFAIEQPALITPFAAQLPTTTVFDFEMDGFVVGVQAGYNWQAGPVVYGLETDLQISGVRGDTGSYDMPHARLDWFGTTRARLGFVPTERLFAYATGGLAYGRVKTHGDFLSASALRTGWTAGAGMEFAIDRHWSVKSEYLYT